jgi:hypothetical protein
MTTEEIINQLRFRYYSPNRFEGISVVDFSAFDLYQKLNTSYIEGTTEIRYDDKVLRLTGTDCLTSVRLYEDGSLVGALDLVWDASITRELNSYMNQFRKSTTPELFLRKYLTGKFFTNKQELPGCKIFVWRDCYLYDAILDVVRTSTPKLKINCYTVIEEGKVIGEFNFGATHIR